MIPEDITVIIPIFKLTVNRYKNFEYILKKIFKTSVKEVIVIEQKDNPFSIYSTYSDNPKYTYSLYKSDSQQIEKTKLINKAVSLVKTKFFCMLDADIVYNYEEVFNQVKDSDIAVQPFIHFVKLDEDNSAKIIKGIDVTEDALTSNITRCFSAGSYIMKKTFYDALGGQNEVYNGWGWEDREFQDKVKNNTNVRVLKGIGYHLHHEESDMTNRNANYLEYHNFLNKNVDTALVYVTYNLTDLRLDATLDALQYDIKQTLSVHRVWVELLFNDEQSVAEKIINDNNLSVQHIIVRGDDKNKSLFQKEALMNIAVKEISPIYRYIIFKDSDVYTKDNDWYMKIRNQLTYNDNMFVQGGSEVSFLNKTKDNFQLVSKTLWSSYRQGFTISNFNPGVCIGITRKLWDEMKGFNPYGVMFYGDTINAMELFSDSIPQNYKYLKESKFIGGVIRKLDIEFDFSGTEHNIIHSYHGDVTRFSVLYKFLTNIDENLNNYIDLGENGLLFWKKDFKVFENLYKHIKDIRSQDDLMKRLIALAQT